MGNEQTPGKILVVDDESSIRIVLSKGLERKGFIVDTASTLSEAGELLNEKEYLCVFLDIRMPDGSGLDLLETFSSRPTSTSIVVMTAEATMKNAIAAMQKGAFDYITKPFDFDVVDILVGRIAEYRDMSNELTQLRSEASQELTAGDLIGRSAQMQEVFKLVGRSANSDLNILITGATGCGKELIARALHFSSKRVKGPFITVNCAAIPNELLEAELFGHTKGAFTGAVDDKKGKFLAANGGTILLDEVGDMPMALQAKMLRVLQEKEFYPVGSTKAYKSDARVLASTNRNLAEDVVEGRFREDLYHRLNVVRIHAPTLADRKDDVPLLVDHFLEKIAKTLGETSKILSPPVMEALLEYDWPGNVRELENVIRRSVVMAPGQTVTLEDIPSEQGGGVGVKSPDNSLGETIRKIMDSTLEGVVYETVISLVERELIITALGKCNGVQTKAAKLLGVNRNTLSKKIANLKIGQ